MTEPITVEVVGRPEDWHRLLELAVDIHPGSARTEDGVLRVAATIDDAQRDRLGSAGFTIEDVVRPHADELPSHDWFASEEADTVPLADLDGRNPYKYLLVSQIEAIVRNLQAKNPHLTTLETLPYRTQDKREMLLLRTKAATGSPAVLITGGVHSRELVTPDAVLNLAHWLLLAYGQQKALRLGRKTYGFDWIKAIVERVELLFLPLVNPDGRLWIEANPMDRYNWRKNRNTEGYAKGGVDINRNFPFLWDEAIGKTSTDRLDDTYRGRAVKSEQEAKNLVALFNANPQIRYFVDVHSFGNKVLYPWGDDTNQIDKANQNFLVPHPKRGKPDADYGEYITDPDRRASSTLAGWMAKGATDVGRVTYTPVQSAHSYGNPPWYPVSGAVDDYAFSRHFASNGRLPKIWAFTLECWEGSQEARYVYAPPPAQAVAVIQDVCGAVMELLCAAARRDFLKPQALLDTAVDDLSPPSEGPVPPPDEDEVATGFI